MVKKTVKLKDTKKMLKTIQMISLIKQTIY